MPESSDELVGIDLDIRDGVAFASINHGTLNLLDRDLFRSLRRLIELVEADPSTRVLVLRSANPDFFIAHYDVELILQIDIDEPARRDGELNGFHKLCERYRTATVPTICEIAGRVGGGGGELAASCDMRFGAVGRTVLCQMEVPLGILPGGSATQRLSRLVGRGRAMEIVLAGDDIDAETLDRWGWLNRAVDPDELSPWIERLARRMASFPPESIRLAKEAVLAGIDDPTDGLLDEAHLFQQSVRLPEAQRRLRAFLERGGQTVDGERRVGELGGELWRWEPTTGSRR